MRPTGFQKIWSKEGLTDNLSIGSRNRIYELCGMRRDRRSQERKATTIDIDSHPIIQVYRKTVNVVYRDRLSFQVHT
ncbi:hypothetical protein KIN20_024782 [Parelaphostrongylus tenuis]|uniref:Uncharacterized protein n=1 Tax=Parelaphostrongylus tenuis TaxID=148309 RepID=A0AAD5MU21_PARTN|nr:hypothetical protein KIN20_024782 [Parelaphostrongylus tenuis]